MGIDAVDEAYNTIRSLYTANIIGEELYVSEENIRQNEFLAPIVMIDGIKGDGTLYCLLIHKKHNHKPETIEAVDFSKVIVANVWEHKGLSETTTISNMYNYATTPMSFFFPSIQVGASVDNNVPPKSINGLNAWESGDYYLAVIYHNSTYNISTFHYGEVAIAME